MSLAMALVVANGFDTFTVEAASWKSNYKKVIKNYHRIDKYNVYEKEYFGSSYGFQKYFISDIDSNGTPELLLYSSSMGLTSVFTCSKGKLKFLWTDDFYKIKKSKKSLVVKGHWHGAGGTNEKEYKIYKVPRKTSLYYIDNAYGNYTVSKGNTYSKGTAKKYKKVYKKYVKGGKKISKFKKYKLKNKSGLNNWQ